MLDHHPVLDRLGLAVHLDGIVTSAEVAVRKPRKEIFDRALALAGASPADARHVGDSLEEDVTGARAAGIDPILIRRGSEPPPVDVPVISSLAELPALLIRPTD